MKNSAPPSIQSTNKRLRKSIGRPIGVLTASLSLLFSGLSVPAGATTPMTPGVSSGLKFSTTVPLLENDLGGTPLDFGTNAGQVQITNVVLQLVLKTNTNSINSSAWTWPTSESVQAINTPYQVLTPGSFCTDSTACSQLGLFSVGVTRAGEPVTYMPSYFSPASGNWYIMLTLAGSSVGTVGLQTGDQLEISFRDGYFNFPANIDDYEFRITYRFSRLGVGSGGPAQGHSVASSVTSVPLQSAQAPSATALVGGARITPSVISPNSNGTKYTITASPQVGGVTKTCSVIAPATSCDITGLTVGENYTFTNRVVPVGGLISDISPASASVSPLPSPTFSSITPTVGSIDGGELVTIEGTNFEAGAVVRIGTATCTDVTVVSATQITCLAPARTLGAKNVQIVNSNGGYAWGISAYTYLIRPTIESITPNSGSDAGGTSITVVGTGIVTAGLAVTIGGRACEITESSTTSFTCTVPSGSSGVANLVVTNSDLGSAIETNGFTYIASQQNSSGQESSGDLARTGSDVLQSASVAFSAIAIGFVVFRLGISRLWRGAIRRRV